MTSLFQDEDVVPVELRHLPEYKELQELKRLRKRKIHELQSESTLAQHVGYKVQNKLFKKMLWYRCSNASCNHAITNT